MYGYSSHMRQISAGISGGMIAHSEGITLGQKMGDTTALVCCSGVSGASVEGWRELKPITEDILWLVICRHIKKT